MIKDKDIIKENLRVSGGNEEVKTHVNSAVVKRYQISFYFQLFL
jgi:hypothetical protein